MCVGLVEEEFNAFTRVYITRRSNNNIVVVLRTDELKNDPENQGMIILISHLSPFYEVVWHIALPPGSIWRGEGWGYPFLWDAMSRKLRVLYWSPPIFFGRHPFAIPSQSPWHRSTVMPHFLSFRFGRVIQCSPIKVSIKQFCGEKGTHCFSKGTQKPNRWRSQNSYLYIQDVTFYFYCVVNWETVGSSSRRDAMLSLMRE